MYRYGACGPRAAALVTCFIILIVATRGTCQPQSHDARLAAVDPWVTANRRRRRRVYIYIYMGGGSRGTRGGQRSVPFDARGRDGGAPLFPFHFASTYPGRPGSPPPPMPPCPLPRDRRPRRTADPPPPPRPRPKGIF